MKALVLNGSSRGRKGLTWKLLAQFIDGLREGGAEVNEYDLKDLTLSHCTGCLSCMHKTPGVCIVKDDMDKLYGEMKRSDLLVIGTPVYTDNESGLMKTVIDRSMCCMEPYFRVDPDGRVRHSYVWRMPARFFLISTCGFPEAETFSPIIATYKAQAATFGSEAGGEICIPGSVALQTVPESLNVPMALIRKAGTQLATKGSIERELLEEVNTPPFTPDQYLSIVAKYEDWCRKHRPPNP